MGDNRGSPDDGQGWAWVRPCVCGLAMGPATGCPFGQPGVCEPSDGASRSIERLRRSSQFQF